jgi:5'-nucleotidase
VRARTSSAAVSRVSAISSFRTTVNSFVAGGGHQFAVLTSGTTLTGGPLDLEAMQGYLQPSLTGPPLAPPATDRITVLP